MCTNDEKQQQQHKKVNISNENVMKKGADRVHMNTNTYMNICKC